MVICSLLFWGGILWIAYLYVKFYYLEPQMIKDIAKKVILITGCDTGFGHLLALDLVKRGCRVYATCLTEVGEQKLRTACKNMKGILFTLKMNVADKKDVQDAYDQVYADLKKNDIPGLYGLVNNAGIVGAALPDDWLNSSDYQNALDVNTFGIINVTHKFKHLVKTARGRIVCMISMAGRMAGLPGMAPYHVSKHAAEAYCDCIRLELKPYGVGVQILEPAYFRTPIVETSPQKIEFLQSRWNGLSDEMKQEYGDQFVPKLKTYRSGIISSAMTNLDLVVQAYTHALFSKHPRARYNPGWLSKVHLPLMVLPTAVSDIILGIMSYAAPNPIGAPDYPTTLT